MLKNLARLGAVLVLGGVALVACGDDQQACAAPGPLVSTGNQPKPPPPKPPRYNPPPAKRTTSKIQDRTGSGNSNTGSSSSRKTTKANPYWKSTSKPTTWGGYNTSSRNWSKPYRKGYDSAPQPVIVHVYNHDYRTYGGYPGYYPVGVWPVGYGAHYGCVADREAAPEAASSPSPAPTVTVTAPPSTTPSATPTETPR